MSAKKDNLRDPEKEEIRNNLIKKIALLLDQVKEKKTENLISNYKRDRTLTHKVKKRKKEILDSSAD